MNTEKTRRHWLGSFLKSVYTNRRRFDPSYLITLAASIILALGVGAVIMLIVGFNPIDCYREMVLGSLGSERDIANTLARASTLCLTGLAMSVAAAAGMFNVGGEGQLFIGAIVSAIVGVACANLNPFLAIAISLLCAALAGALLALFPALLKVRLGVSEVVVTILLNSAVIYFCSYLASGPFKASEGHVAVGTEKLARSIRLTSLVRGSNLTNSIFAAAVITFLIWYFMKKTAGGYEYRMTGLNSEFSAYSGIKSKTVAVVSMIISGAVCGCVGMFETFANGRFVTTISNEFYFDGMLVAMIMRYNPLGIVFMSLFFAMMKIGALKMELNVGISGELILVIQSIIIFFMAAENGIGAAIKSKREIRRMRKELKNKTATPEVAQ